MSLLLKQWVIYYFSIIQIQLLFLNNCRNENALFEVFK